MMVPSAQRAPHQRTGATGRTRAYPPAV